MQIRRFLPILAALILAALLCACAGGKEERTEHERLFLVPGEEVTLRLKNIPEGRSAGDFTWECGRELAVSPAGELHAQLTGQSYVRATLKYKGTEYIECIPVTVVTQLGSLTLDTAECLLLSGNVLGIHAETDQQLASSEKILWTSSDESVVTVARNGNLVNNFSDAYVFLTAGGPGEALVTASFGGLAASCRVRVWTNDSTGKLGLLYAQREKDVQIENGAVRLALEAAEDAAAFPAPGEGELAAAPAGKYLLRFYDDDSLTVLLPPAYRPDSFGEVAFLLELTEGDEYRFSYDSGAEGRVHTVDVVLRDAATGRTLETLAHLEGPEPANTVYVPAGTTVVWGAQVAGERIEEVICSFIASLWLENARSVEFCRGEEVVYSCGGQ